MQGDREKAAGLLVSPLMDRSMKGGMTRSQVSMSCTYVAVVTLACILVKCISIGNLATCCDADDNLISFSVATVLRFLWLRIHVNERMQQTLVQAKAVCMCSWASSILWVYHCSRPWLSCLKTHNPCWMACLQTSDTGKLELLMQICLTSFVCILDGAVVVLHEQ